MCSQTAALTVHLRSGIGGNKTHTLNHFFDAVITPSRFASWCQIKQTELWRLSRSHSWVKETPLARPLVGLRASSAQRMAPKRQAAGHKALTGSAEEMDSLFGELVKTVLQISTNLRRQVLAAWLFKDDDSSVHRKHRTCPWSLP